MVLHVKQVFLLVIVDETRKEGLKQKILPINLFGRVSICCHHLHRLDLDVVHGLDLRHLHVCLELPERE